jgi:hypothetical protein
MIKLIISFNVLLFSLWAFGGLNEAKKAKSLADMPMCSGTMSASGLDTWANAAFLTPLKSVEATPSVFETDTAKAYAMPLLTQTPKGDVMLSWTEKDTAGVTAFCVAFSKDKGQTFSEKKVIYAGTGVGNSRLMRAKILTKQDGSLVAIFSNRITVPAPTSDASTHTGNTHNDKGNASAPKGKAQGGGRSLDIVYCTSKDGGATWTSPQSVDADPTKGIVKGFFDAAVLANDEIAVAYLKDVANSTKHEERDLRLVVTKNGVFQPERVIDPVVCDCCNINFLIDATGALNIYYRDNNDDIRDIAKMTSKDNAQTFSKPEIVHNDGWKIAGCPHSGAVSVNYGKTALIAWYSGAETETGFRLVTQEGKKLFVLNDPSVKNPSLMSSAQGTAMLWVQNVEKDKTQLVYRKIDADKTSENLAIEGSTNATNSTGLIMGNQLLVVHEVKKSNKKNGLRVATTRL